MFTILGTVSKYLYRVERGCHSFPFTVLFFGGYCWLFWTVSKYLYKVERGCHSFPFARYFFFGEGGGGRRGKLFWTVSKYLYRVKRGCHSFPFTVFFSFLYSSLGGGGGGVLLAFLNGIQVFIHSGKRVSLLPFYNGGGFFGSGGGGGGGREYRWLSWKINATLQERKFYL